jgi:hypothetical protein
MNEILKYILFFSEFVNGKADFDLSLVMHVLKLHLFYYE